MRGLNELATLTRSGITVQSVEIEHDQMVASEAAVRELMHFETNTFSQRDE